jgi:acetolactate decarboxylase
MKIKQILHNAIVLFAAFCCGLVMPGEAQKTKPAYRVAYRGAMRDMFAKNDLRGKVDLQMFRERPHIYALGPLENLTGEVLVWDGVPYTSRVEAGVVKVETSWSQRMIFGVWAQVAAWREVAVPASVTTYDQFEKFVLAAAKRAKLDVSQPFPLLLKGTPARVEWHVIALKPDGTPHTREKHEKAKVAFHTAEEPVEMLGFYSEKHAGVFVHHTHRTHIHVRTVKGDGMGHVEDLTLKPGMVLSLPIR